MRAFGLHVGFGAAAPDHDESGKVVRFAELLDIVHDLFGKLHLVLAGFHVRPLQPFDVVLAENGSPWFDLFDLGPNRVEETLFENTRLGSTFVAVVLINVPAAEGKIIERRKWHEILDLRDSSLCPLTKPNGSQLRQRSNRLRDLLLDGFHTGDERCADRTHARNQNAELPGWCFYFEAFLYHFPSCETGAVYYEPVASLNRALRRHIPLLVRRGICLLPILSIRSLPSFIQPGRFTACSPIGEQEIPIHSGNHFETDFLRAHGFAFANIGAAPEHLLFDLRHHI